MNKSFFILIFSAVFIISCEKPLTMEDLIKSYGDSGDSGNSGDSGDTIIKNVGEMVSIPAGYFWMGCNDEIDSECKESEKPYHKVTLSTYKIDKYEVTVEQYKECVDAGVCEKRKDQLCNFGVSGKENHPINCVSWVDAKTYCEWAGKRLPTEAEWEKAARGTDGRIYPWGNESASCEYSVISGCGTGETMEVGSKPSGASPYGVFDMSGNVREWCSDYYQDDYYENSPSENPKGPKSGYDRVIRGGSYNDYWVHIFSVTYRLYDMPDFWDSSYMGFRCAK